MNTTYIQFELPKNEANSSTDGLLKKWLLRMFVNILTTIIPKANPDFEDKINKVRFSLVEFETERGLAQRELGLDMESNTILKMPYKDNYGYWTDNNLLLDDFRKRFQAKEIDRQYFEDKWDFFI